MFRKIFSILTLLIAVENFDCTINASSDQQPTNTLRYDPKIDKEKETIKNVQVEVKAEENSEEEHVPEPVEKVPRKALNLATPLTPLKLKQENSENIQKPITLDDPFKSPFLSPSISHQKRPEFVYNPLDQQSSECIDDPTKSPIYSNKVRQRIRPTPYFGRRNSVQADGDVPKKSPFDQLDRDELIKKCKGLLVIAKNAKQAKDEYAEENAKQMDRIEKLETQKLADRESPRNLTTTKNCSKVH